MCSEDSLNCYDHPRYWDFAFSDETPFEADFIEAVARRYCRLDVRRLYEPGCGGGRLVVEMAKRGYDVVACDLSEPAIRHASEQLARHGMTADLHVEDMTGFRCAERCQLAFNTVNTFRHLLTEEAARAHLCAVADSLESGGVYVIGLHLIPPDADEEDSEEWTISDENLTVCVSLEVMDFNRETRLEQLRFELAVNDSGRKVDLESTYSMRLYMAEQMQELLATVAEFELCEVFDFCYDIHEPLQLNDDLGDTVLVLRKR